MVQVSHATGTAVPLPREASSGAVERAEAAGLAEERAAEQLLVVTILKAIAIAVPVMIVVWIVLIVVAIDPQHPSDWGSWLGLGAGIGVLYGVFFGALAGFVLRAPLLDHVDQHAMEMLDDARTSHERDGREPADPGRAR
jgi:hypothetical protein